MIESKAKVLSEAIRALYQALKDRRWRDAVTAAETALSTAGGPPEAKVHALVGMSEGYTFLGDLIKTLEYLDAAWDLCWDNGLHYFLAPINYRQAECYMAMGDPAEAYAYFNRALSLRNAGLKPIADDSWLWDLGGAVRALVEQRKMTEARRLLRKCPTQKRSESAPTAIACARMRLSLAEGKFEQCLEMCESVRSETLADRELLLAGPATTMGARAALELRDAERALEVLSGGAATESLAAPWFAAEAHYLKGEALRNLGRDREALEAFRVALRTYARIRFTSFRATAKWTRAEGWSLDLCDGAIQCALDLGMTEEAIEFAAIRRDRLMSRRYGTLMAAKKRRESPDLESRLALHEKHLVQRYDRLIEDLRQLPQPVSREHVLERLLPLREEEYEVERWKNQRLDWPAIDEVESFSSAIASTQLQRRLNGDELLLVFHVTDQTTRCWSIDRTECRCVNVKAGTSELQQLVGDLRSSLKMSSTTGTLWWKACRSAVLSLGELLFADIAQMIIKSRRIVLVPDGPLCYGNRSWLLKG